MEAQKKKKPKKPIANLANKRRMAYKLVLIFFALYIAVEVIWHFFIYPASGEMPAGWKAFLFCAPLLLLLPGLVQGSAVKHLLLALLTMGYFSRFLLNSFEAGSSGIYSVFACLVITGLFLSSTYYARWQGRSEHLALQAIESSAARKKSEQVRQGAKNATEKDSTAKQA